MPSQNASKSRLPFSTCWFRQACGDWIGNVAQPRGLFVTLSCTIEGALFPTAIPRKLRSNLRKGVSFDARLARMRGKSTSSIWMPGDFS